MTDAGRPRDAVSERLATDGFAGPLPLCSPAGLVLPIGRRSVSDTSAVEG